MASGGKRAGAGRKPKPPISAELQRSAALEVLSRLGELGLPGVKSEADYCIHLMKNDARVAVQIFMDVRNRAHGKPAQAVIAEGKLTIEVVEIPSGDRSSAETGVPEAIN